jgi:hypothetical protein
MVVRFLSIFIGFVMKLDIKLKDIKFNEHGISQPIVMQSTAGWYVGQVQKDDFFLVVPYDRLSDYYSLKDARNLLKEQKEVWK